MIGIYFSGTGNTKHCSEYLLRLLDENAPLYSIENEKAKDAIQANDEIIFAYPVYYSYLPKIVYDFIVNNSAVWKGKNIFVVATMGLFSGDGAGCAARLFKKYGAKILGGLHIKMPDCIGDVKLLKKSFEENKELVKRADAKIENWAKKINVGKYPQDGLNLIDRIVGCIGQRLWFRGKTKNYSDKLKISNNCIGCGLCAKQCPMGNIELKSNIAIAGNRCTMCYRCIGLCPKQAITLLGNSVIEQCRFDKYKNE